MPLATASGSSNSAARDAVGVLNEIIERWEEADFSNENPSTILLELCELFEKHTNKILLSKTIQKWGHLTAIS